MRWIGVFLGIFGLMGVHGQTLSWSVDTNQIRIGEHLEIVVSLSDAPGFELQQFTDTLGALEIISQGVLDTVSLDPMVVEQRYVATGFDTGYFAIQPVIATAGNDTLRSEGLFFEIQNPDDVPEEIEPIHPPENAPKTLLEWLTDLLLYVFLPAGLLFAVYYLWKRLNRKKSGENLEPSAPAISPEEWLKQAFAERRAVAFYDLPDSKQFYDEMTDLIREYLSKGKGIPAMEMVTSELLNALSNRGLFVQDHELLRELLQLADMAKFAKGTRTTEMQRRDFDRTEAMVMNWIQSEQDGSN